MLCTVVFACCLLTFASLNHRQRCCARNYQCRRRPRPSPAGGGCRSRYPSPPRRRSSRETCRRRATTPHAGRRGRRRGPSATRKFARPGHQRAARARDHRGQDPRARASNRAEPLMRSRTGGSPSRGRRPSWTAAVPASRALYAGARATGAGRGRSARGGGRGSSIGSRRRSRRSRCVGGSRRRPSFFAATTIFWACNSFQAVSARRRDARYGGGVYACLRRGRPRQTSVYGAPRLQNLPCETRFTRPARPPS